MEQSPLVQVSRPDVLKPKVVNLYESLFKDEYFEPTEGFWRELFLLKPNLPALREIVGQISADDLLHHHELSSQELFQRAIHHMRKSTPPADEIALDTLTAYLEIILRKRYTSPSSDIIAVLAGLEDVDTVLTDFVNGLEEVIREGRNRTVQVKAVKVANAAVSGAYQTGLVSYFLNRDLFPALIKHFQQLENPQDGLQAFALLGLLANYNKFEFANPYRTRMDDLVNETAIQKIVHTVGQTLSRCRDEYLAIQDDQPEAWNPLGLIGLGSLSWGSKSQAAPVLTEEEMKRAFSALPPPEAVILLPTYELVIANSLFCLSLTTSKASSNGLEAPIASFLSFGSYVFQNAHRSIRASTYACMCCLVLQIMMEDQTAAKTLCESNSKIFVRLCRQRTPVLPSVKGDGVPVTVIMDLIIGGLGHNMKLKLDVEFYDLLLTLLLRITTFLSRARIRLTYHWPNLWRTLLSFLRFLSTYPIELAALPSIHSPVDNLLHVLAFAVTSGESFLPDAAAYDDLFYKIVELAASAPVGKDDAFTTLQKHFGTASRPTTHAAVSMMAKLNAHYRSMLEDQKGRKKALAPGDVSRIIKQGYETLDLPAAEAWGQWTRFREVERKVLLKKAARVAVADVRGLLSK